MARAPRALNQVETWIFDLDNTLYPGTCSLYPEVETRMNDFIMAELKVDRAAAETLRRRFFAQHGTTLRGLMLDYGLEPRRFLDYVHELDLSGLPRNARLAAAIAALPGRKLVFTNATARHAERVLHRLGIDAAFCGIHDIEACNYVPKPDPSGYRVLLDRHRIDAEAAAMVEDMAKNLVPAAALGMTTIWVKGGPHGDDAEAGAEHIHHVADDLADFLAAAAGPAPAAP
ncbi:MAG TPA: pyrimidine 5'-nucleotidase [Stellaceae bacterium]|nr:pyrimidine 5'-nucleotidase [Stellaceae bacterium]